jgi:hypothetical protein
MGIASFLLGENNPFAQWAGQNQNTLSAIGAGLAQGQNLQGGLAAGLAAVPQAKQLDQAAAEKLKAEKLAENQANATKNWLSANHPDLAQMVDAGMPVSEAWQAAMKRMEPGAASKPLEVNGQLIDPNTYEVLGDYRTVEGKGGNAEVALQPTWLQDAQGNWVLGQLSKDGSVVQTKLPDGMRPADPGQVAGTKTGATVDAKTAGAARAALPGAQQMLEITNKAVQEVRSNSRGMNEWFGQIGPRGMYVNPGSEMGKFLAASSPTNAQAFMQARNMLKGGGQITDYEGRRAEDAISRMQAAIDKGDQDQYLRALADFEQAVAEGYQKLVATAQGGYSADGLSSSAAPPAALSSGNVTSSGVQWSVEP